MKHELWIELERKGKRQLPKCLASGEAASASEFYNLNIREAIAATQGWDAARVTAKSANGKDKVVTTVYPDDMPVECAKTGAWSVAPSHNANQEYEPKPEPQKMPAGAMDAIKPLVGTLDKFTASMDEARKRFAEATGSAEDLKTLVGPDVADLIGFPGAIEIESDANGITKVTYNDGRVEIYDRWGGKKTMTPIYADDLCSHTFGDDACGHPKVGDCDKTAETCRDKFHNLRNFGGFPQHRPTLRADGLTEQEARMLDIAIERDLRHARERLNNKKLEVIFPSLTAEQEAAQKRLQEMMRVPYGRAMGSTRVDHRSYGLSHIQEMLRAMNKPTKIKENSDGTIDVEIGDYKRGGYVDEYHGIDPAHYAGEMYKRYVLGEFPIDPKA